MIEYIIKVIEPQHTPEQIQRHTFRAETLERAQQKAKEYLWSCPTGTKYIYLQTKIVND